MALSRRYEVFWAEYSRSKKMQAGKLQTEKKIRAEENKNFRAAGSWKGARFGLILGHFGRGRDKTEKKMQIEKNNNSEEQICYFLQFDFLPGCV